MRSVELFTTGSFTLDGFADRLQQQRQFRVGRSEQGNVLLQWREPDEEESHLQILLINDSLFLDTFSFDDLAQLPPELGNAFTLPFRGVALLKEVLAVIADDARVWVEVDEASACALYAGSALARRMRLDPAWNLGL